MLAARITGVGRYLPERVLTNHELATMVDTSDEWIVERSGIRERRIAAPDETSSTLGTQAALAALESAQVDPADIDLVLTGTCTPDGMFPSTSTLIQHAIGAPHAGAFDINAACNGFLSALHAGAQFIATGSSKKVLVVGAETMSRIVDWSDRTTCVLFGDGAGAVVLEPVEPGGPGGVVSARLRSDGAQADLLYVPGPASARPDGAPQPDARLVMDGRGIFRSAVTAMSREAERVIVDAGLTIDDIALCVPHQANLRILNAMAKSLGLPIERVYINLERYGNTSSATIPIALAEATAEGRLKPGDKVLFAAFGGGLSWGAMVMEWSGVRTRPDLTIPELSAATASTAL